MTYCEKVIGRTPTRLWINNPTLEEIDLALSAGVKNCTTNPAYCNRLIKNEPGYLRSVIDSVIVHEKDDDAAADLVYQCAVGRILKKFANTGYVTSQPDPRLEADADRYLKAIGDHIKLAGNYMAKIPVTAAGIKVIEAVLRKGTPVCATEIFSVSQAICVCGLHKRVCEEINKRVPIYITHITGIFDECLSRYAKLNNIDIAPETLGKAGAAVGRKQYRMIKNRGYDVRMLGGGARGACHFTDFVGGDMDVTLNWSTIKELDSIGFEPVELINEEVSDDIIQELRSKFDDFRKAYDDDALCPEEFEDYRPVALFRNNFLEGYYALLAEIAARRAQLLC